MDKSKPKRRQPVKVERFASWFDVWQAARARGCEIRAVVDDCAKGVIWNAEEGKRSRAIRCRWRVVWDHTSGRPLRPLERFEHVR